MAKLLSNTRVYGTGTVDTQLFVKGFVASHSTNTGALQVSGGIGIAGGGFFSGAVTATTFSGAFSGTASLANDLAGGTAGQLVYQIGPSNSGFAGPGTAGQVLTSGGTGSPVYVNTTSLYVGRAVVADSGTASQLLTQQRTTSANHFLLFVDSNNVTATAESVYTTSSFVVNPATGAVTINGNLSLGNYNLNSVNHIVINDPGVGEGIQWNGGSGWYIYESPDTLTNAAGNLQIVTGSTRRATFRTDGTFNATGGGLFGGTVTATNFVGSFTGGSTQANTEAQTGNASYYPIFVDSNNAVSTAETLYTTSSFVVNPATGNVGIGVAAPGYKLDVNGDIRIGELGTIHFSTAAGSIEKIVGTGSELNLYADADIHFYESDSNLKVFTVDVNNAELHLGTNLDTTTPQVNLDASGNSWITGGSVGIGTNSPQRTLHVAGSTGDTRLRISANDGTNYRGLEVSAGTTFKGGLFYRSTEGNLFQIWGPNSGLAAMYIDSNNVVDFNSSIATHSTATGAVQIIGGLGVGGGGFFGGIVTATTFVGAVSGSATQLNTQQSTTNAAHYLTFVDSNNGSATAETVYTSSAFVINPAIGEVGINATLPAAAITSKLFLGGDFTFSGSNRSFLGNLYYDTGWKYAANGFGWGFREDGAGKVQFLRAANNTGGAGTAATVTLPDLMTWDLVNNRVGIGTASPAYKLDVNGDVGLAGTNLYFDGGSINLRGNTVFNFLTDGGSAQSAKFKSIQVSTSYSGLIPDNGILFSTDSNLYRSGALTLRTNSSLTVDGGLDVTGTSRFRSGYIGGDTQGYPNYDFLLDFGSDVANTWRKLVTVVSPTGQYQTIGFKIEITDPQANHGTISSSNQIIKETYYVACVRTNDVTQDTPDACYVYGPGNRIRAIKTAVGAYEIHIQNAAQYREYRGSISVYAVNGAHTVTYSNGTTIGTALATYTATNSTNGQERISGGLSVSGNVGIGTTGPGFNLDVTGTARATADFRAPIFYDTNNTAYYDDPASTSNINNMNFAGIISSNNSSTRTKYRVYGSGSYAIGMQSGVTFGGLNDWAMTFQFNNDDDRGFWWGDDGHSVGQGAMALNTRGWLTVAERIKVGGGQSDTADPSGDALQVVGIGSATTDFRAPIFYDSGNTSYYMDPAGTSRQFATFDIAADGSTGYVASRVYLRSHDNYRGAGIYMFGTGNTWFAGTPYTDFSGQYIIATRAVAADESTAQTTYRLFWIDSSGNGSTSASLRSPIFYDSNNTAYYTDPASTSALSGLRIYSSFDTSTSDVYASMRVIKNNNSASLNDGMYIGYGNTNSGLTRIYGGGATSGPLTKYSNYALESGSFRAPIFYDSNNTAFYTDPASNSILNTMTVNGINCQDTRATATTPQTYNSVVRWDFKTNTTNGLSDGGTYNGTMYWRKYGSSTDWSGGGAIELAYTDNARLWMRYGSSTTWGSWKRVLFGDNFDNGGSVRTTSLGVGTAASGTTGEIRATNEITAYYSDERLKTVEGKIENALDKVDQLSGYYYTANEEAGQFGYDTEKKQVGVLAQEVEKVLPEIVTRAPFDIEKDENGNEKSKSGKEYKTVKYEKLIPLLIEAIKELKAEITRLKQ